MQSLIGCSKEFGCKFLSVKGKGTGGLNRRPESPDLHFKRLCAVWRMELGGKGVWMQGTKFEAI